MTGQSFQCHICGGALELSDTHAIEWQVTSDCRPWRGKPILCCCAACGTVQKPVTEGWRREVENIYANYAVYSQGGGTEQTTFDATNGQGLVRSQRILRWLSEHMQLPTSGKMLDIGCGNGSFLSAFSAAYSSWELIGTELDSRNRKRIEAIPGVSQLHVGSPNDLEKSFDIIVMIHALEHIPNPLSFLQSLHAKLRPNGKLLIEVPDLQSSPFDLMIADHCTHFSASTLKRLLCTAGYEVISIDTTCVAKELTILATPFIGQHYMALEYTDESRVVKNHLEWLHAVIEQIQGRSSPLGIFGSSIAATWLAAHLDGIVSFFLDEDSSRIGSKHIGLPILGIENAPLNTEVLMPMPPDIAAAITRRLGTVNPHLVAPPPFV
jgi:SAM-dependent methyltransferase